MPLSPTSAQRGIIAGVAAAALLIGAFALGTTQGGTASAAAAAPAVLPAGAASPRITVTGTGTVSGTPDQLVLSMGVQTSGGTVSAALQSAIRAVRAVTGALTRSGVRTADIQTSGLSIQPEYSTGSAVPTSYGVSESIQVTLRNMSSSGAQISRAVRAGGNATVVNGVSLNLSDTSSLLSAARARAAANARTKAAQYARALGRSLGPVVSISEQAPVEPVYASPAGAQRSSAVPVSPGSQQLTVTVIAVFALA